MGITPSTDQKHYIQLSGIYLTIYKKDEGIAMLYMTILAIKIC